MENKVYNRFPDAVWEVLKYFILLNSVTVQIIGAVVPNLFGARTGAPMRI